MWVYTHMNDIVIEQAGPELFPQIWPIFHAVIQGGDAYPYSPNTTQQEALAIWHAPTHRVYVAKRDDEILGSYYMRPNHPGLSSHVANAGYMVSPQARGQGIGRLMGVHSLKEAARVGYRAMQFNLVVATNSHAVTLWQSLGFHTLAILPRAFNHQDKGYVDALIMFREL